MNSPPSKYISFLYQTEKPNWFQKSMSYGMLRVPIKQKFGKQDFPKSSLTYVCKEKKKMSNFWQFRFMSLQETLACCFPLATQSCQFINTSERVFLVAQMVKHLPAMQETRVQSLGGENPLEKVMSTHCSILARRIPWTEEPGRLQSMMSQRVRHD